MKKIAATMLIISASVLPASASDSVQPHAGKPHDWTKIIIAAASSLIVASTFSSLPTGIGSRMKDKQNDK
jgi:hypothetical protein